MELCRVCMQAYQGMEPIFDANPQQKNDIVERILFCTGVLFTNEECLPTTICKKCLKDLSIAYRFKKNCLDSQSVCQNLKTNIVKTETDELSNLSNNTRNNDHDLKKDSIENQEDNKTDDILKNNENDVIDDKNDHIFGNEGPDDEVIWADDVDLSFGDDLTYAIKVEAKEAVEDDVKKSNRVRLKNDPQKSVDKSEKKGKQVRNKRGPYKKTKGGTNLKLKKLKFKRLTCEVCQLKFVSKKDSDDHKRQFHNSNEKWICEICGKMMHPASHSYHIRSHFPPRFACDGCDYKSNSKQDLVKHMRIHSESKSYICPICATSYRTSSNLHTHIRMKHNRERRFPCPLCNRAFYDRTKLNRHVDSHNDVKRHCCEVCNACFTRRCYWKKHLQRQHGIIIPAVRPGRQRAQVKDLLLLEA